jgi:hypothetical protein
MFDEIEMLRQQPSLIRLLGHYAGLAEADPEAWQDRLMQGDGLDAQDLTVLHGMLLAHGWIVQNTGVTPVLRLGHVPCCYRVTTAGKRALRQAQADEPFDHTGWAA